MCTLRALLGVAIIAAGSCRAPARQADLVPGPEGGPPVTRLTKVGKNYELRDAASGAMIMQQRNALAQVAVYDPRVTYTVQMNEQPTGYDMVVTFTNPTGDTVPVGTIYAGMLTIGQDIEYLDVRHSSVWRPASFTSFVGRAYMYPNDLYSPIFEARGAGYAVGVSLRYPAIEYDHDVRVAIMNPTGSNSGEGGPGWGAGFRFSDPPNTPPSQALLHPARLSPYSSKQYVLCVRVTRDREDWMTTLLPYRRYFRAMYGGVSYERMTKPILPIGIADGVWQEPGNIDGYGDPTIRRPDVFGWGPWADSLVGIAGYSSVMLWAPSGMYFFNPQYNYPFQITTRWQASPELATAFDPEIGLPRVAQSGKTLGLWWGRSLDISSGWDPAVVTPLDPANPAHVAMAEAELSGAIRAGVTLIGMDTCNPSINGIRNAYLWIKHLRERFTGLTFVAEPSPCDILNTLVGGVLPGWALDGSPKTLDDCYPFRNPHYLADFLLPGHETIMSFRYNNHWDFFGWTPTEADIDHDVRWFASMGYIPMVWSGITTVADVEAAETWTWTVPPLLRMEMQQGDGGASGQGSDDAGHGTTDGNTQDQTGGGQHGSTGTSK